jgi:NAD(P) transhydrogenase subunit alpha
VPAVPTTLETVAASVPAAFDAIAPVIEPGIDAITTGLKAVGQSGPAVAGCPFGTPVVVGFDPVAPVVEALRHPFSLAVKPLVHSIAPIPRQCTSGRSAEQQHGDCQKTHHGHVASSSGGYCGDGNARGQERLTSLQPASVRGYDAPGALCPGREWMSDGFVALYIFMLAAIAGHVIISRVPVILHTPLMSGSNFIHGIVLIGAMVVLGHADTNVEKVIGFIAVLLGAGNAAGGYVVTERMLDMFKSSRKPVSRGDKA